jgi:hypothetical protein
MEARRVRARHARRRHVGRRGRDRGGGDGAARGPLRPWCSGPLGPEVPAIPILTVPTIPTGRTGRTGPLFRLGRWACGIPARTTRLCSEDRKKDCPRVPRSIFVSSDALVPFCFFFLRR